MKVSEAKFSALGVNRAHLQDVVQVDLAQRLETEALTAREALSDLVAIIEKAGLLNLSNGVQLGATSWYVKASDALGWAKAVLAGGMESPSGVNIPPSGGE